MNLCCTQISLCLRQRKIESGSLSNLPFGPDPPSMPVVDALHDSEPNAGPLVFAFRMEPVEGGKELIVILHIEPDTIVFHPVNIFPVCSFP